MHLNILLASRFIVLILVPMYGFGGGLSIYQCLYFILSSLYIVTVIATKYSNSLRFGVSVLDAYVVISSCLLAATGNGFNENFFYHANTTAVHFTGPLREYSFHIIVGFLFYVITILGNIFTSNEIKKREVKKFDLRLRLISGVLLLSILVSSQVVEPFVSYYRINSYVKTNHKVVNQDFKNPLREEARLLPKNTGNLVFIFLESYESLFINGKGRFSNLSPNLSKLFKQGIFVEDIYENYSTSWTAAGIFSHLCGFPLSGLRAFGSESANWVLQSSSTHHLYCLSDYLKDNQYENYYYMGSSAKFGGMDKFLSQHNFDQIYDYDFLKSMGIGARQNTSPFGYKDHVLFDFFLKDFKANEKKAYFISSIDTHFPGFSDEECKYNDKDEMIRSIRCSDLEVFRLVEKIIEKDPNVTIAIAPDHLMHGSHSKFKGHERRRFLFLYNRNISSITRKSIRGSSFDFSDTVVGFLGGRFKSVLGTNLLNDNTRFFDKHGDLLAQKEVDLFFEKSGTEGIPIDTSLIEISYDTKTQQININENVIQFGALDSKTGEIMQKWSNKNFLEIEIKDKHLYNWFIHSDRTQLKNNQLYLGYIPNHGPGLGIKSDEHWEFCKIKPNEKVSNKSCKLLRI